MSKRRVVVTGIGIVSPVGNDLETAWKNIVAGKSGIRLIKSFDTSDFTTKFAGSVVGFDPSIYVQPKEIRKNDPFILYGIAAGIQAIEDAGLSKESRLNLDRIGFAIGSGIGGLDSIEKMQKILLKSGPKRISPFFIPGTIINMIAGNLSIRYGYRGPNLAVATACATGTHALGLAARTVVYGDADVMISGGAEYASTPLAVAGFGAARALSVRNDAPEKASRPWDVNRDGFVLGDGAGVMVLEEYEHAKKRKANIYAELAGFGMSGDAFHITRPPAGAAGAVLSIESALQDSGISIDQLDYINAHGTSTTVGDIEEISAIKQVLKTQVENVSVSSTKSMIGHLLGAAGAVEAIFTVLAIRDQIVPPTINLDNQDEGCNIDLVPHIAKERTVTTALSNSFGFGGTNGSLLFKRI